jgi:hypothetical protein
MGKGLRALLVSFHDMVRVVLWSLEDRAVAEIEVRWRSGGCELAPPHQVLYAGGLRGVEVALSSGVTVCSAL